MKMKNREIDLLIVVNMFLTGFDATTLNTLWVDKNLKQHGLIQAFSRTNRILNSVKTYGNIVCFRDLEQEVIDAISLFGDKDAEGIVLLKNFDAYYYGYEEDGVHYPGFVELVDELESRFPLGTEIISGDSRQVYRRMDLGTGKDLADYVIDGKNIPYHLIDIVEPGTKYNVFEYQRDFLAAYEEIHKKGIREEELF